MTLLWIGVGLTGSFVFSWWLSGQLRRYALERKLIDTPNERSSHALPTPRGGGVAFVATTLLGLMVLMLSGTVQPSLGIALLGGGGLVAFVGWLDDQGHLAAQWRLLAHSIAAVWGLVWIGGLPPMSVNSVLVQPGLVGQALATLYLIWMVNLFNFMDGIDALASLEAISVVSVGGALVVVASRAGPLTLPFMLPLLLAASVAGFLLWNWPPARLFMGDTGSGFLGFTIGLFTLQAGHQASPLLWSWLILMGVFLVDATWTLVQRILRRQRIWEAHRSHAYQRLSRLIGNHWSVSVAVLVINLGWLTPIAALVAFQRLGGPTGLFIALAPLWAMVVFLGAGGSDGKAPSKSL